MGVCESHRPEKDLGVLRSTWKLMRLNKLGEEKKS